MVEPTNPRRLHDPHRPDHDGDSTIGWVLGVIAVVAIIWIIVATWSPSHRDTIGPEANIPNTENQEFQNREEPSQPNAMADMNSDKPVTRGTSGQQVPAGVIVITRENIDNIADYVGRVVTVQGEVKEVIANRGFRVAGDSLTGGDEALVLSKTSTKVPVDRGQIVSATGTVRIMTNKDFEDILGVGVDLAPFATWENHPVIVVEQINPKETR